MKSSDISKVYFGSNEVSAMYFCGKKIYPLDSEIPVVEAIVVSATNTVSIDVKEQIDGTYVTSSKEYQVLDGYSNDINLNVKINATDDTSVVGVYISEENSVDNIEWITPNETGVYDYVLQDTNEGEHTLYVYAKDTVGNIGYTEASVIYDITPPTIVHNGNTINDGDTYYYNASFKGSMSDSSGILVMTMNQAVRTSISTASSVTYVIVDNAGNIGTYKIVIDTTAPAPSATYIYNMSGSTNYLKYGNVVRVVLHFTEELSIAPTITIGKKSIVATASASGSSYIYYSDFTLNDDVGLEDGEITFVASGYTDLAGNVGEDVTTANKTLIYDTTTPTISGVEDGTTYDEDVTITVTDTYLDSVVLTKDNEEITYTDGMTISDEGSYTIVATDLAGNESTLSFTIEVGETDTEIPVVTINTSSSYTVGGLGNSNIYSEISVISTDDISLDALYINDVKVKTLSGTSTYNNRLVYYFSKYMNENQENTIYVTDTAGNQSESITFVYDGTTPTISGIADGDVISETTGITITDDNLYRVDVYYNDSSTGALFLETDYTSVFYEVNFAYVSTDGLQLYLEYGEDEIYSYDIETGNYKIVATDLAGNTTTVSFTIEM